MEKPATHFGRREFLTAAATSGVGLAMPAAGQQAAPNLKPHSGRRRVVLVGTGVRGSTNWGRNLVKNYSDVLEFVGLCDINRKRLAVARDYIGVDCPLFADTEFDEMIRKTSPDVVIVTTVPSRDSGSASTGPRAAWMRALTTRSPGRWISLSRFASRRCSSPRAPRVQTSRAMRAADTGAPTGNCKIRCSAGPFPTRSTSERPTAKPRSLACCPSPPAAASSSNGPCFWRSW
jgi:hypothetical protein